MTTILDTTVLTDALLKTTESGDAARREFRSPTALLPVYAIKEFKQGPLAKYVYLHNKLCESKSLAQVLTILHGWTLGPARYFRATLVESLREAVAQTQKRHTLGSLAQKYGKDAEPDVSLADEFRLQLRLLILRAWKKRRNVGGGVCAPLSCYREVGPRVLANGLIEDAPRRCDPKSHCCLGADFHSRQADLKKLLDALRSAELTREVTSRRRALKRLVNGRDIDEAACRDLGDAVFALQSPRGATIVTTNLKDHEPLANALGLSVRRPA